MADFDLRTYDPTAGAGYGYHSSKENVQQRVLISSVCQVLTRVDRTLAGRYDIKVQNGQIMPGCPAATVNGREVNIDFSHEAFKLYTGDEAFMHVLGLNYHEEAHVLFTPVMSSMPKVYSLVQQQGSMARFAWNALEDGRIERLIGGEYGAVRGYLLNTFAIMAGLTDDPDSLWAITAPRHQELPDYVVEAVRMSVVKNGKLSEAKMDRMESIAKRFTKLILPRDDAKAEKLIREYMTILVSIMPTAPGEGMHRGGEGSCNDEHHTTGDGGQRAERKSEEKQEEAQDAAKEAEAERKRQEEEDAEWDDADEDVDGDADADDEAEGDGDSDAGGDGDPDEGDADADAEGDADGDTDTAGGTSAGSGTGDHDGPQDVVDALGDLLADVANMDDVQSDLGQLRDGIYKGNSFKTTRTKTRPNSFETAEPMDKASARRIGAEFTKLAGTLDPGWDFGRSAGKLNTGRFMRERDFDTAFDTWREDHSDAADVETLLLMDMSGSMGTFANNYAAARAAWVIRQGLQSIGAHSTGYGFDTEPFYLWSRDEAPKGNGYPVWKPRGGTALLPTLYETMPLLMRSRAKSKLLIILTDGAFRDAPEDVQLVMDELVRHNTYSMLFELNMTTGSGNVPCYPLFNKVEAINSPIDMVGPVKDTVKELIRKASK